jgi:predicted  nucleic acid-binding Zn-ribbon protein
VDDLGALLTLQEHDLALDRLRHRRATLPARTTVAEAETEIATVDAESALLRSPLGELARNQERLEDEAQALAEQAKAADRKLYSGEVSSPRELQALQADIEQLKRHQRTVEERALEVMEQREPLDAQMHALLATREERSADLATARAELAEAEGEVDGEIAIEQGLRDTAATAIDAPLLVLYERCRTNAPSGIGAARLVGHTCQGCHLTIPATEVDALRKAPPGTVAHCDNCGAILVP